MENPGKNQTRENSSQDTRKNLRGQLAKKIFASKAIEKRYSFKFIRKLVHVAFSSFGFVFLFIPLPYAPYVAYFLYTITIVSFIGDTIRIHVQSINTFIYKYLGMLFISRDKERYSSGTYYLIGASLTVLLFPYRIAGMGIVFLGIGDFMASLGGTFLRRWVPYKLPKTHKTWIGLISFVVSTNIIGYFAHISMPACIIASIFAALSEVYLVTIDDNLSIPIIGSLCLFLLLGSGSA